MDKLLTFLSREDYWGSKTATPKPIANLTQTMPTTNAPNGTVAGPIPMATAVDGGDIDMLDEEL